MKTWRPNQSGTFSNRVNIHDKEDRKLFVIEFYTDYADERQKIMSIIENAPELLEALQELMSSIGGGDKFCKHDFCCNCAWDKAKETINKFIQ